MYLLSILGLQVITYFFVLPSYFYQKSKETSEYRDPYSEFSGYSVLFLVFHDHPKLNN